MIDTVEKRNFDALELRLTLDKDSCLLGEDVKALVVVRNRSDSTVTVDDITFLVSGMKITDEGDRLLSTKLRLHMRADQPTVELGRGDSITTTYSLSTDYGFFDMETANSELPIVVLRQIRANYYDQVFSAPVPLEIVPPVGDDKSALKMILRTIIALKNRDQNTSTCL